MAYYLSPGVDVNEIDKSTYVSGVATTISAIVLRNTYKGDELKQILITNEDDLISTFGIPIDKVYTAAGVGTSESSGYQDMFSAMGYLKYGTGLYCTRTMPMSATFAGATLDSGNTWNQYTANSAKTLKTETYTTGDIYDPDDLHMEADSWIGTDQLCVIAKSRGYWGNNIRVAIVDKTTQTQILSGGKEAWTDGNVYNVANSIDSRLELDTDLLMLVQVREQNATTWSLVEVWNVSLDVNSYDDQGQTKYIEEKINRESKYIRVALLESVKNEDVPTAWAQENFQQLGGGQDLDNASDIVEDGIIIEGYNLYSEREEIDVNLFIDSNKSITVKEHLITLAESRMDAMIIADVPYAYCVNNKGSEATDLVTYRKFSFNANSSYIAIYANWLEVYDRFNRKYRWVPISGYIAGIYANNDDVTDPWFAPAGLNRGIITGARRLGWSPTKGERDSLYIAGLNPVASFAGQGKVVWGQKTMLDKSSAFDRVNVRRLFLTIEKAISKASMFFVFQPNDRDTRRELVGMIDPFLADVKARRGVYDYEIICDSSNNTSERIDRNELWVDLKIKPTKAAEFIVLNFIAVKTGVSFSEV